MFHVPEKFRVKSGPMASRSINGNNGLFIVKTIRTSRMLTCIASDGMGWEHVSVSLGDRCPTWEEMSIIKSMFWDEDDLVIQIHPPKQDYVNTCKTCLHLWRKAGTNDFCEIPPVMLV